MQSLTVPKKKGKDEVSPAMRNRVVADLENAGISLTKDLQLLRDNQDIFRNPETDNKVRSEIVDDMVSIFSADIQKIEEARRNDPAIRENERNPEYKKAMDAVLSNLREGLNSLTSAQFDYGKVASKTEFQREHKTA